MYHGTTIENLRSIATHGLRKGTWVTPDFIVAQKFAEARSKWNHHKAIILWSDGKTGPISIDKNGQREAQLSASSPARSLY